MRSLLAALILFMSLPAMAQDTIPAARVVLPWSDFKDLYDRGMAPQDKPEPAPRDVAISRAVYSGRVEGDAAIFTARVQVDVLKDKGWVVLPVLPTSVALRQARIGNQDAAIFLEDGWYRLITNKRGALTLDLEFAVSTFDNGGQHGFAFALPGSGGTEVTLSVPAERELSFDVADAQRLSTERKGGVVIANALVPPTGNLAMSWQEAAAETVGQAEVARVYAEHQALVGVNEGLLQCTSTVNYAILHAGIEKLELTLPANTTVLDVRGQGIRDYGVTQAKGRTNIAVDLSFEAKGSYTLVVEYEAPIPEGSTTLTVPDLQILGVERVKGWVGVDARSNVEIASEPGTGTSSVDVRELPAAILGKTDFPILLGYKYNRADWSIPLKLRTHPEVDLLVTLIDQAAATTVLTPDGRRMTQVVYAMRNNNAQFLRLKLPEGAVPWSTFVAGRAVKPGRAEDGQVLIPLTRSQTAGGDLARFGVELVYVEEGVANEKGATAHFDAALPVANVPSTGVAWTIYTPRGAELKKKSVDGTLRQVTWFTPIDVAGTTAVDVVNQVQAQAAAQEAALADGVQPVKVALPIDGNPIYFERLLVFQEPLQVSFDWKAAK